MVNKTDTQIPQLIINKLTKEQYEQALAQGLISETELYAVTDEDDYVTVNAFNNIIANYTTTENLANVALSGEYSDLLNKPELANVALSGEYSDLLNTPTISTVGSTGEWSDILNKPEFANVATSGEYGDLLNTPTVDQTYNGSSANAQSGTAVAGLIANYSTTDSFSNVAFSGDFADLTNVPAEATVDQTYNGSSTNAQSGVAISGLIANYTTTADLADVALSGEYSDLLNKPTIDQTYNGSSANAQSGTAIAGLISNYMTSSEVTNAINTAVSSVYRYKGSVATYADLPSSDLTVGDVYNVESDGHNYAWTGTEWDRLAGTVDLSDYVTLDGTQTLTNKTIDLADNTVIGLSTVATSGEYSDLLNKPTIDQTYNGSSTNAQSGTAVAGLIANYTTTADLADVALSGEYSDLLNKPELADVALSGDYADLTNTPSIPDPQVQTDWNATSGMGAILNKPHLMSVATSGEYSDLLNTPNVDQTYNGSSANAQSGVAISGLIANYTDTANLANVALSGEYSDLLNVPTIDQTYNGSSSNAQSGTAVAGLIANYMTSTEVASAISNAIASVYRYKGSVATYADLPSSDLTVGDVYNVEEDGANYAWTGTAWDKLSENLSNYVTINGAATLTNKTIDLADNTIIGLSTVATSGEYSDLLNTPTIDQVYNGSSANAQSGVAISGLIANYSTTDAFSNVAFSGDFADLINVPTVDQVYNGSSANAQSGVAVASAISDMQVVSNMVDTISNTSTNTTYPTTSAVYNSIANLSGVVFREWE